MVQSAGTMAMVGSGMDPLMSQEAERRDISASGHHARQLTGRILKDADLVLVFGPEHVEWISAEAPEYLDRVAPVGRAAEFLRFRPRRAMTRTEDLLMAMAQQPPECAQQDWIADPYQRGEWAARDTVNRIVRDVGVLARRLDWLPSASAS